MTDFSPKDWLPPDARQKMLDEYIHQAGTTWFGYEKMRAHKKKQAVTAHFNRVAPTYDFMNSVMSFGIHHAWKRAAVRMLGLQAGQSVVDVCGGTGDLAVLAARRVGPAGTVCICDMNSAMMAAGRNRPENRAAADRVEYVLGDAEHMPFPDSRFDAAMVGFGIRNVTHLKQAFSEMHRVLKPGGKMLCLEFSRPLNPVFRWLYDFYSFHIMPLAGRVLVGSSRSYLCLSETIRMFSTADELKTILETIGFTDVTYRRFTNGIAVAHVGKREYR